MFSKIWMINIILAGLLVMVGANIWDVWHAKEVIAGDTARNPKPARPAADAEPEIRLKSEAAYDGVVSKNLFSPDRAESAPDAGGPATAGEEVRISGEKVVLYGVLMSDDTQKALINNVKSKSDPRSQIWIAKGDRIGDLRVDEIGRDYVVLNDGTNIFRVMLYDPDKSREKNRPSKSREGPEIVHAGQAARSGPATDAGPKASVNAPKTAPKAMPSADRNKSEDGEYEIIDTPFGKIKRKIR